MATMTMTADPEDQGGGWWWPFKKKNPSGNSKGGGGNGAEEKQNIGRFLGVTLSVLGCTALAVSGFAIPALLSLLPSLWVGHSFGAAYDEAKHIEVKEKQQAGKERAADLKKGSEQASEELLPENKTPEPKLQRANYIATLVTKFEDMGQTLDDNAIAFLEENLPEQASKQEFDAVMKSLSEPQAQRPSVPSETNPPTKKEISDNDEEQVESNTSSTAPVVVDEEENRETLISPGDSTASQRELSWEELQASTFYTPPPKTL